MVETIESLWLRIGPILNYDFRSGSARVTEHVSASHHERIVNALEKGDASGATQALAGDLEGAADFIVSAGVLLSDDPATAVSAETVRLGEKRMPLNKPALKRLAVKA